MTKDVGAITGELEVVTRPTELEGLQVAVRYAGADEWYTVEGSPIGSNDIGGSAPSELSELHERVVEHLATPGPIVDGNEEATSLQAFSPMADNS